MITPGVIFSPGQLVTANMLNNLVTDARINEDTIEHTQLKNSIINDFEVVQDFVQTDKILIHSGANNGTRSITIQDLFDGSARDINANNVNTTNNLLVGGDLSVTGETLLTEGIECKYTKITGFDPDSPTNTNGDYTAKISLSVEETITCDTIVFTGNLIGDHFMSVGQITHLQSPNPDSPHMIQFGYVENGAIMATGMPMIANRYKNHPVNQGLQFTLQSSDPSKTTDYSFRGDVLWLYAEDRQQDQSVRLQLTAKDDSDQSHSWYIRSFYPLSSGRKILEILSSTYSGTKQVNIGSSSSTTNLDLFGTLTASGTKNFRICHPVLEGKDLQHCAIEAPKGDLIYRGKHTLGTGPVNLDNNANMAEGTFVKLVKDVQVFAQNNVGWDRVKGRVEGNLLYIDCENAECTDIIDWLVIGERQDDSYINGDNTDDNGNFITELDCNDCTPDCTDCLDADIPASDHVTSSGLVNLN